MEKTSEISKEKSLRFDFDFLEYYQKKAKDKYYKFKELFQFYKGDINILPEDNFFYAQIWDTTKDWDVIPVELNFNEREEINEDYYKKIEKWDIMSSEIWNILISKVRPNLKKFIQIDEENNGVLFTKAFLNLKPNIMWKVLYYWFRTIFYRDLLAISRQWKWYPTLKEDDLSYLKFDKSLIDKLKLKEWELLSQIEPIEKKIKQLKFTIKPIQKVINEVFAREFWFSENLYQEFWRWMTTSSQRANTRKHKIFSKNFLSIWNNKTNRFSTRYHNPPTKKLMDIINWMNTMKVKDIVLSNDKWIQPNYDTEWTIPVIKIANMKNLEIDLSECEFISESDFISLNEEKKIKRWDIIICWTWKASLWKIDIYESDEDAVTTVDNLVLRLSDDYNKLFFVYFFRSILWYFQIERDFTWATNQIHLYRDWVSEFRIPNIPLSRQEKIVEEIQAEIDKQSKIKKEIQQERAKIDEIIENCILN